MSKINYIIDNILFLTTLWVLMLAGKLITILPSSRKKIKNSILFLENLPIENAGYQNRAYWEIAVGL